jgi:hypothetical protein
VSQWGGVGGPRYADRLHPERVITEGALADYHPENDGFMKPEALTHTPCKPDSM